MYFIMADSQIVGEVYSCPTDADLQEWANDLDCEVWVLQGEHFGMTAQPDKQNESDDKE